MDTDDPQLERVSTSFDPILELLNSPATVPKQRRGLAKSAKGKLRRGIGRLLDDYVAPEGDTSSGEEEDFTQMVQRRTGKPGCQGGEIETRFFGRTHMSCKAWRKEWQTIPCPGCDPKRFAKRARSMDDDVIYAGVPRGHNFNGY